MSAESPEARPDVAQIAANEAVHSLYSHFGNPVTGRSAADRIISSELPLDAQGSPTADNYLAQFICADMMQGRGLDDEQLKWFALGVAAQAKARALYDDEVDKL